MATVSLDGTASNCIKYSGTYDMYFNKSTLDYFCKLKDDRIVIGSGSHYHECLFDTEAQRDAAMVALLTFFNWWITK